MTTKVEEKFYKIFGIKHSVRMWQAGYITALKVVLGLETSMQLEQIKEIKERLEKFKKENPKEWVYRTNDRALEALYQTTIRELEWVLKGGE